MKKALSVLCLVVLGIIGGVSLTKAQTSPVALISAPSGSTLTNCGTPTVPSVCVVGTGVYVWQNSTTGWFLPAPISSTSAVQKVNGIAPGSTGNVTVSCPSTSAAPAVTVTGATVSGGTTITQLGNPSVVVAAPAVTTACTAVGS